MNVMHVMSENDPQESLTQHFRMAAHPWKADIRY